MREREHKHCFSVQLSRAWTIKHSQSTWVHPRLLVGCPAGCCWIFSFLCSAWLIVVLLPFFFWPLYCLSFFDIWLLIIIFFKNLWYVKTFLTYQVQYILSFRTYQQYMQCEMPDLVQPETPNPSQSKVYFALLQPYFEILCYIFYPEKYWFIFN